jgi:ribosomal protein L31E
MKIYDITITNFREIKSLQNLKNAEAVVKDIRRQTKRKFSSEKKIRISISRLDGKESIIIICRKDVITSAFC